jgi:hypothetical protein
MLLGMVQANPQILQPMLHELGKANPHLLELINTNQEEFLRLINEPQPEGHMAEMAGLQQMMGGCVTPLALLFTCTAVAAEMRLLGKVHGGLFTLSGYTSVR